MRECVYKATQVLILALLVMQGVEIGSAQEPHQPERGKGVATLAPLGDSRTAIIAYDEAHLNKSTQCHLNWANALHQQKYPLTGDFGISGATTDRVVAEMLAPALATHAAYMPILMGVNDVRVPGFNSEHTMANIALAANKALEQGTIPILFTDPGSERYTAAQVEFINDLNVRIKEYCTKNPKAVLFDMAALISTQRSPKIMFQPGWCYDGIHLQTLGAYKIGEAFAALLDSLGAVSPPALGGSGNLVSNADFAVATGGSVGKGNSGDLPESFAGQPDNSSCVVVFSNEMRKDGGREIIVTVSTDNSNKLGGARVVQKLPTQSVRAGDSLVAGVQVDIDPGSANLADVRVEVDYVFGDGTFALAYDFSGTVARDGQPARDTISSIPVSGVLPLTLQTPPIPCPSNKTLTGIKFVLGAKIAGQGKATVRFRNPWCVKKLSVPGETSTATALLR